VKLRVAFACLLSTFSITQAAASEEQTNYDEPGLTPGRTYDAEQFAEKIDPFSGNITLQYVDLVLPGNAGFDLKIRRIYNSNVGAKYPANAPLGRGWDMHFGRIVHTSPILNETCQNALTGSMVLEMADGTRETLHKSSVYGTSSSDYVTNSFWKGQCDASGGVIMRSPDGTRYDMTVADGRYWHVARITDKFGNWMSMSYVTDAALGRQVISQVSANDGRQVNFSYAGNKLVSVSGGGVTWSYNVTTASDGSGYFLLSGVTPPAGGGWSYNYNGNLGGNPGSYLLQQVTNPFGGVTTYSYQYVNFLPAVVGWAPATAIQTKVAGGNSWNYSFTPSCGGGGYDVTTVALPAGAGTDTYRHFGYCSVGQGTVWMIGLLYQKTSNDQTETYQWSSQVISNESLTRPGYANTDPQINRALLQKKTIARDGGVYTTSYSSPDSYGNPTDISEVGTNSRTRTVTYFNDATKWIIGLVNNENYGVGSITRTRGSNGELQTESRFGVTTTYVYNGGDGTLSSVTTAKPATTSYSGYYRGVPTSEVRPDNVTITRSVNALGRITSQTDGVSTWGYGYDNIGRLTSIDFPAGSDATIAWTNTTKILTRGNLQEETDFDGFGHTTAFRKGNIWTTYRVDALGRRTFESLPGSSAGTTYTYDSIDRVTSAASSVGTKRFAYSNNAVSVTDERSNTIQFGYTRYGDPDEGFVTSINPTGVSGAAVTLNKNEVGVLLSANQNGVTRTYGRGNGFFLTSLSEPEEGTVTYGRDGVGNMTSKSVGGATINYGYDGMSRLTSISSSSGLSVSLHYDNRGKLTSVTNPAATRTYAYDANGNLTGDTLQIDNQNFYTAYSYDGIDGLNSITYPMNKGTVTYSPDALGRPTQASPYLYSVNYFSSGNVSALSFANGVYESLGEDNMQRVNSISASSIQLGLSYNYDGASNPTSITNSYFAAETRNLNYDALNRLTSASGPWGIGSITYDGGGNITRQAYGGYSINYTYAYNRINTITGNVSRSYSYDGQGNVTGDGVNTYVYDALSQLQCMACGTSGEVQFQYDGQGKRVSEASGGNRTYFVQAPNGDLQFEYTPYGKKWVKHIYLRGKRVATESGSDATATTLSATYSPSSPQYGDTVTITATIAPGGASGTVEFIDGDVSLGTYPLVSGVATYSSAGLTAGPHTITANYSGDASYASSTGSVSILVAKKASATSMQASSTNVGLGQTVTLTASVTGTGPTGSVEFMDGTNTVATVQLASGTASVVTAPLSAGSHSFTAVYSGDDVNLSSSSSAQAVGVQKANPTMSIVSSHGVSGPAESITFSVTMSGVSGFNLTGSVSFSDGSTPLGSVNLAGGAASVTVSSFAVRTHLISVAYGGDGNYTNGTAAVAQQVQPPVLTVGKIDFDGDGHGDLTWANGAQNGAWLMNSSGSTSTAAAIAGPTGAMIDQLADFDGDGKTDILWRSSDGSYSISLMDGLTVRSTTLIYAGGTWTIIGTGDFDADGKADLIWKNTDGTHGVWTMDGVTMKAYYAVYPPTSDSRLIAAADFDGDGKTDLVWRKPTGEVQVNLMDDGAVKSAGTPITVGNEWDLTRLGDFDGDHQSDMVWRRSDGYEGIWMMAGTTITSAVGLWPSAPGWRIGAVGDFDGDGKSDLLWTDDATQARIDLMSGTSTTSSVAVPSPGTSWVVQKSRDFTGDGKADVYWRKGDGSYGTWVMNSTAMPVFTNVLGPSTGWEVAP
jgi:YD repeat-containing protein